MQRAAELRDRANLFVAIEGKRKGPFSLSQLAELAEQGRISAEALVHNEASGAASPLSALI